MIQIVKLNPEDQVKKKLKNFFFKKRNSKFIFFNTIKDNLLSLHAKTNAKFKAKYTGYFMKKRFIKQHSTRIRVQFIEKKIGKRLSELTSIRKASILSLSYEARSSRSNRTAKLNAAKTTALILVDKSILIDKYFKFMYPIGFVLFNLIFFFIYMF